MCPFTPFIAILIRRATRESLIQVPEGRQLLIGVHNEMLSVAAMCICNPDCLPVGINR